MYYQNWMMSRNKNRCLTSVFYIRGKPEGFTLRKKQKILRVDGCSKDKNNMKINIKKMQ